MDTFSWHDYLMMLSFLSAIAGLVWLLLEKAVGETDAEVADRVLFMMSFAYWLVYCVASVALKFLQPEWETAILSVKLTGVLSYLLTATCILSLPLHRVSMRQTKLD